MTIVHGLQLVLITAGTVFFIVGSVGLLRFPDVYTRIHALTKADNLGLGLIVLGLLPGVESVAAAFKLLLVWGLALVASACAGYLVARSARRRGVSPWQAGFTPDDNPRPATARDGRETSPPATDPGTPPSPRDATPEARR